MGHLKITLQKTTIKLLLAHTRFETAVEVSHFTSKAACQQSKPGLTKSKLTPAKVGEGLPTYTLICQQNMLCALFPGVILLLFFHQQQFHKYTGTRKRSGSNCEIVSSTFTIHMEKHTKRLIGIHWEKNPNKPRLSPQTFFHSF